MMKIMFCLQDENAPENAEKSNKLKESPIVHVAKKLKLTMLTDLLVLPSRDLPQDFAGLIRCDLYKIT
jgi:hypothetical protein